MGDLTRVVTLFTRPRHSRFPSSSSVSLFIWNAFSVVKKQLLSPPKFSKLSWLFVRHSASRAGATHFRQGIPLSSSHTQHSHQFAFFREPLDLFHFVVLFARCYCFTCFGGKLDCSENKLLIKQIDTRTHTISLASHTLPHTMSAHSGTDDGILPLLHTKQSSYDTQQ